MTTQVAPKNASCRAAFQKCKFCNEPVNLDDEGAQYPDGTCAHEGCEDGDIFRRENAPDFRD